MLTGFKVIHTGRPSAIESRALTAKVAALIPEDGIRFKELEAKCKQNKIGYKAMLNALDRLQKAGTVVKDAVKADRGAGTSYRRTAIVGRKSNSGPFIFNSAISNFRAVMEDMVGRYLFSWDKIPGDDNKRFIEFLIEKFEIDWVKTARIEKIDDNKTIRVTTGRNFLSLRLNNEKTKINLKIDDGRVDEYNVEMEDGNLNIYVWKNPDKNEAEKWAAGSFYHAYATICQVILNELELSLSYPEPEERFDSALNDFIVPLIKQLAPYFQHPSINNERAKSALFEAIMLGDKEWDKVWKSSASRDSHQK